MERVTPDHFGTKKWDEITTGKVRLTERDLTYLILEENLFHRTRKSSLGPNRRKVTYLEPTG